MKVVSLLAGLLVVQGQSLEGDSLAQFVPRPPHPPQPDEKGGYLDVPNFYHYVNNTAVGTDVRGGVAIKRWNRIGDGFSQETIKPPALHKLDIPAKKAFPPNGKQYWLITPATYVVTKGSANFKDKDGKTIKLTLGQLFYSPAGILHGPIEADSEDTAILVLGDFPPRYDNVPDYLYPKSDEVMQHAFQPKDSEFAPTGLPGFPDCITIVGGPVAIAAKLTPHCTLPYHFHATGAFYFFTKNPLVVGGDYPGKNVTFPPGTSRWARPGWAYGPEESLDEETWFMVLGEPPTKGSSPDVPSFLVKPKEVTVAYKNTQFKADNASKLSQKRARRHLRSSSNNEDLDETILLQQPYTEDDLESDDLDDEELENEEL